MNHLHNWGRFLGFKFTIASMMHLWEFHGKDDQPCGKSATQHIQGSPGLVSIPVKLGW